MPELSTPTSLEGQTREAGQQAWGCSFLFWPVRAGKSSRRGLHAFDTAVFGPWTSWHLMPFCKYEGNWVSAYGSKQQLQFLTAQGHVCVPGSTSTGASHPQSLGLRRKFCFCQKNSDGLALAAEQQRTEDTSQPSPREVAMASDGQAQAVLELSTCSAYGYVLARGPLAWEGNGSS